MKTIDRINISRRKTVYLVFITMVVFLTSGAFLPGWASEDRLDLVRIDVDPSDDLRQLAALGLTVYARLYTSGGDLALVLGADTRQQVMLTRLGYRLKILARVAPRSNFYLLYGLPGDFLRVGERVPLLVLEGRQAVATLSRPQMSLLDELGVGFKPVYPQPLMALDRPQTTSRTEIQSVLQADPLVQQMIDQVNATTLATYVGEMSGEWAVIIEDTPFTLSTRYSFTDVYIAKATRYAYERFTAMGLPAGYQAYSLWGTQNQNIHAWQPGAAQPEREFLVTAHLDSTSQTPYSLAPGADDNASGSAAVLAVADILRQYTFGCSIRYALFTGEEQGMVGSSAFAQELAGLPGIQVEAVLNLDMISYNTPGSNPSMELHVRTGNADDLQIAGLFQEVVTAYDLDLMPAVIQPGNTSSDHSSFWNLSIPAILAIEDWSDHTPNYHQSADQLETLNLPYFTEFTKAALGTLAHMGCLLDDGVLKGTVKDATTSAPLGGVRVTAALDESQSLMTTTKADGSFQMLVAPGDYTVDFHLPYYLMGERQGVAIERAKANNLMVGLAPCGEGVSFTSLPILPSVGESITFTAGAAGLPASDYEWDFGDGSTGSGQSVTHAYNSAGLYTASLEILSLCPLTTVQHSIPVGLPALFFPLVSVSPR